MKKEYLIIGMVLIIIAIAFYFIGFSNGKNSSEKIIDDYKKIIDYYTAIPDESFSISGEIIRIENNTLSIEIVDQNPYILPNEWGNKIIKVSVSDKTEITKFDTSTATLTEINLSELKIGDKINATSEENIKDKKEFTANFIQLFTESDLLEPILEPEEEIIEPEETESVKF